MNLVVDVTQQRWGALLIRGKAVWTPKPTPMTSVHAAPAPNFTETPGEAEESLRPVFVEQAWIEP